MLDSSYNTEAILYLSFNYDKSFISVGTQNGFKVLQNTPLLLKFERNLNGGIGIVEMLSSSNIFCLVGGGRSPKYPPNKVLLWDDKQGKEVTEFRLNSYVKNIKIKRERLFIICEDEISIINLGTMTTIEKIDTIENPNGSCAIAHDPMKLLFAYPDITKGQVRIKDFEDDDSKKALVIKGHENCIAIMEFNYDGSLLATTSEKGTLIRIYNTTDGNLVQELRRGSEKADIYSIAFDIKSQYIIVASDRGTVHLFSITKSQSQSQVDNTSSKKEMKNQTSIFGSISKMIGVGKVFESEWSFSQFKIPIVKSICCINDNYSITVVNYKGRYYNASFSTKSADCKIINETSMINL